MAGRAPRVCPACGLTTCGECRRCGRWNCQHKPCPLCRDALEHHPDGKTTDEEWEAKARMALARREAGLDTTQIEKRALLKYPDPARLTISGYRRSDGTVPPWVAT